MGGVKTYVEALMTLDEAPLRLDPGQVIFEAGDAGSEMFIVRTGSVDLKIGDTVLETVEQGGIFGELALVDPAPRSTTVAAVEAGETLAVGRDDFDRLRRDYPQVNEVLVHLLAARVRRAGDRLLEALFVPAETRVLRRLLELVDAYGRAETGTAIPLTQEDIAALAATSRATANRVLRAEQRRGTLRLARGKTLVVDPVEIARRARSPALDRA
jgi:CRP-like cAMP-binding protein